MKKALILLFFPSVLLAQQELSATFEEFSQQVNGLLTPEQIACVGQCIPVQCEIYGYAVGDYSGDYLPDLAISIRTRELRGKKMKIYYFVSDEEQFIEARETVLEFWDVPIEIGFLIDDGICYTTQKKGENDWAISGYCYRGGNFFLHDYYETMRRHPGKPAGPDVGYEITRNYRTLGTTEQYYNLGNKSPYFTARYFTFPAYPIEKNIHPYLYYVVRDTSKKFLIDGAGYLYGRYDADFESAVFYDDSYLYFFAWVTDDSVQFGSKDMESTDHVELWFDLSRSDRLLPRKTSVPSFRTNPDDSVFMVAVAPGISEDAQPRVQMTVWNDTGPRRRETSDGIRVQSDKTINGYSLRIRIPFGLFGGRDRVRDPIGYTMVLHDVDGTSATDLATSAFQEWNPSTFGILTVMTGNETYGEVIDLNTAEMIRKLNIVGISAL